jgi:chromosome segregation protein
VDSLHAHTVTGVHFVVRISPAMRLKTLTLNGYKTFASRMHFEFGDGITCIIGPNGSGKSNIADGIRWALGEQQFSLLRGKKTEDMIFSGSARRPRASMAEVILTFDNSDGFFPITFTDIEIGRRAFRDGANEYIMNGNRVRLRDVGDLLSHSGLAERTYTVIGQGLVDNALAQKPEERRALFEEAAGIGAYRDRREDALRKLEETRHNLERARDILAEITPRLSQLERQAARARQYKLLADELDGHTRTWLAYHYHALQQTIARSTVARDAAQTAADEALAAVVALDDQGAVQRSERQRRLQTLTAAQPRRETARAANEAATRELAVMRERTAALEKQIADAICDAAQHVRETEALELRAAEAAAACLAARAAQELRRAGLQAAQAAATDRQTERAALDGRRTQLQEQSAVASAALLAAQNQVAAQRARRDALRGQLESMIRRANELGNQREAELRALDRLSGAINHDASQTNLFDAQFDSAQQALDATRAALVQAQSALAAAEAEEKLTSRMTLFAELRAQQSADELAASASSAGLAGVRGPLSSFVHIHPDDQRAAEAALGDFLNALVIAPGESQAGEAGLAGVREWLTVQPSGQLAILLTHALREFDVHRATDDRALTERARATGARPLVDAIGCPDWLRPAVHVVAGRTFIARDLDAARALAEQLPDGGICVTRDGEVAHAIGTLSLPAGARSPVAHGAETKDAFEMLDVEVIKANLDRARTQRGNAQHDFDAARQALAAAAKARDTFVREAITRRSRMDESERKVNHIEEALAALAGDMEAIELEIAELDRHIEVATADLEHRRSTLAEANLALSEIDSALSDQLAGGWLDSLNAAQSALAEATGALQNAEMLQRERDAALALAQGQRESRARRIAELAEYSRASQTSLERLAEVAARAEVAWRDADAAIEPIQAEVAAIEARLAELDGRKREAERALREAESRLNTVVLELARHNDELDNLRLRASEVLAIGDPERQTGGQFEIANRDRDVFAALPLVDQLPEGLDERIAQLRSQIKRLGAINYEAQDELEELAKRHTFITEQGEDLERASTTLTQVIAELNDVMKDTFRQTFDAVATAFHGTFKTLFGGGHARLTLLNPDNIDECGVDIHAQPPGKRPQSLALLSGGERSLTATALLFAILQVKPTPFCVLDEVDAALDESNVGRFRSMVESLSVDTQFILITHNRRTVEAATTIYGITMGADGASTALSLRLEEVG